MSGVSPSLRCPCEGRYCTPSFRYDRPPEGETRFDLGGSTYQRHYDQCGICDHFFSRHQMDLSALYDGSYVDSTYGGENGMRARLEKIQNLPPNQSDNLNRVARIESFVQKFSIQGTQKRLLDVGAGIGVFPAAMKQGGWDVTAVEPDLRTVKHLREVVGVDAYSKDIMQLTAERTGLFELITFNKVLEHVEDPVAMLSRSKGFLSDGGFIYVELPDVAAAVEGPDREEFFIEHHHVFSPASLAMLASRSELYPAVIERLREPSRKFTLRAFLLP